MISGFFKRMDIGKKPLGAKALSGFNFYPGANIAAQFDTFCYNEEKFILANNNFGINNKLDYLSSHSKG